MWFEVAQGVSLENLGRLGKPATNKTLLLELLQVGGPGSCCCLQGGGSS
jgi:hypothetical protein